jgi:hypothetical protein
MLKANPLNWLLENDSDNPGVRYFALRDLMGLPETDAQVRAARAEIMRRGPVPVILAAQHPEGYWVKPGSGYSPKYRATIWAIIVLAELGANPDDPRIQAGCEYLLTHSVAENDAFSVYRNPVPHGALLCLNGNLLYALCRLGYAADERLQKTADWLARAITGEAPIRYYPSGTAGPGFACGVNLGQACGWGANKAIRGLLEFSQSSRSGRLQPALEAGADFLLSRDPAVADYPYTVRVSNTWFRLGFPLSYWSDVLETVANLVELGYGADPRVQPAVEWLLAKQDAQGRWKLENSLNGKMWVDIERRGKPSKWVTLRAMRVLQRIGL